ncbi:MAG: heterodisulfide reductase subunit [Pseudonocardiales bacterium]|nr:heterodisulfide reductase subunit [Pseudonocardiales bacterium]
MKSAFETALAARVDTMVDACTTCGKCFEACPIKEPAGVAGADPRATIAGILDIVRTGDGPEFSRKWASACILSGECIKACDYGVNPRFLLNMARVAMARARNEPAERRRIGVEDFRKVSRDVTNLSRMQLADDILVRLGQLPTSRTPGADDAPEEIPDVVFYTGCNVLKTPHIALLALDIMDALGTTYHVMGGPSHCCGIVQLRPGDIDTSGRFGENTMDKLARSKTGQVLAWCPSCLVQFNEVTLPTVERTRGARPFDMTPFFLFLRDKLDRLRPMLQQRVEMRIALHRHPGVPGVMEAAMAVLTAVPGIELVDLHQPAVGLMSNYLRALPTYKRDLQRSELEAARDAGVDALVTVYHADHRELCAHERDWPFQVLNALEIVGASMGLHHEDQYKRLKKTQDVETIVAECSDLAALHGLDPAKARLAVQAMLDDQPLRLVGTVS